MAQKKPKVSLSALFTDKLHTDEMASDPSPLTPLTPETDIAMQDPTTSTGFWHRYASHGFLLPGESEGALAGPEYPESEMPKQEKLTTGTKNLIKSISKDIMQSWPPFSDGVEAGSKNVLVLVNAYAFVTQVFNVRLQMVVNKDVGEGKETSVSLKLQTLLQGASSAIVSNQVLFMFIDCVKKQEIVHEDLKLSLDNANIHTSAIKRANQTGKKCRKQAAWIGLEKLSEDELEKFKDKHMVETPEQGIIGVEHQAFGEDGYICLQNNTYRICAPDLPDTDKMTACIFWTKTSPTDTSPTWDKVFGALVYNVECLDTKFDQDNEQVASHMKATIANVIAGSSTPIVHGGMVSDSVMTKVVGHTSTYGTPHDVQVAVPKISSKNPKAEMRNKIAELQQLRLEIHEVSPVMQVRNHAFLEGFLPNFAEVHMKMAQTASNARNILGYPHTSAFGTYAYCASAHIDRDESSTSGWVMKRSAAIKRDQSNFVWASHSLVVEMAENVFWFWNAPVDKHGTTMNNLALKHPDSYKSYITKEPDRAQWTRVSVMTHAVGDSR